MARKRTQDTNTTEQGAPHGEGGSYVIGEDGIRRLVERTEHRIVASVEREEQERQAQDALEQEQPAGE